MKKFSLKATLLTIVAALTIGFTSCSDELSGDQTQGKPGYLTINLKTLKPKQTKSSSILTTDYQKITDLNVLIYRSDGLILKKYFTTQANGNSFTTNGNANTIEIKVGELDETTDNVVVLANYGEIASTLVSTTTDLQNIEVPTVGNFPDGLCMTGVAKITNAGDFAYSSAVKIAPVVSKISVNWTATGDANYYNITGIYIVNAINKTKLPIILRDGSNNIRFPITPGTKTASSAFPVADKAAARDYNIYHYTLNTNAGVLSDEAALGLTQGTTYSYYVGENYHADLPTSRGDGSLFADAADNNNANANTIILIEATPKTIAAGAPAWIANGGPKYYTYDLSNAIKPSNDAIKDVTSTGFSTKRKTNYVVTFNLTSIGTANPFEQLSTLHVTVQAQGWDLASPSVNF